MSVPTRYSAIDRHEVDLSLVPSHHCVSGNHQLYIAWIGSSQTLPVDIVRGRPSGVKGKQLVRLTSSIGLERVSVFSVEF